MFTIKFLFWACLAIVVYTYVGYAALLWLAVRLKRLLNPNASSLATDFEPFVTMIIAAWNEEAFIKQKIENTLALDYPAEKLQLVVVSDGSTDRTPEIARSFSQVTVLHQPARNGKTAAMNRAVEVAAGEVVVFSDANALLNSAALRNITRHFANPHVGCVAGEKRIVQQAAMEAAEAGEGLYWRYESALKKLDSELATTVGAAGELFALRTALYRPMPANTILDDFMLSLTTVLEGYKIAYEPNAYAMEHASANTSEEMKRKIRISAGGLQSIVRLAPLANPFRFGVVSWQYLSHRVFRWTAAPLALGLLLPLGAWLAFTQGGFYALAGLAQLAFYFAAVAGYLLERKQLRFKALFVPWYFTMMNAAVWLGLARFVRGKQSVRWERAARGGSNWEKSPKTGESAVV